MRRPAARRRGRGRSPAPPRERRTAQSSSAAAVRPPCSASSPTSRQDRELEVLGIVDEHVAPARRGPRPHVRAVAQSSATARSTKPQNMDQYLLGEHPVVGAVDGGELALALPGLVVGGQRLRPCVVLGHITIATSMMKPAANASRPSAVAIPPKSCTRSVSSSTRSRSIARRSAPPSEGTPNGSMPALGAFLAAGIDGGGGLARQAVRRRRRGPSAAARIVSAAHHLAVSEDDVQDLLRTRPPAVASSRSTAAHHRARRSAGAGRARQPAAALPGGGKVHRRRKKVVVELPGTTLGYGWHPHRSEATAELLAHDWTRSVSPRGGGLSR